MKRAAPPSGPAGAGSPPSGAPRRARWRLVLLVIGVLLLAFGTGFALLLSQPVGLRAVVALAPRVTGGGVTIGAVSGRLIDDFELRDFTYVDPDGTRVRIARAHLRWRPSELRQGRLHAQQLEVERLEVDLPAPTAPPTAGPTVLPTRAPLDVQLDALELNGLTIRQAESGPGGGAVPTEVFALAQASASASWIGDRITLTKLDSALPETGPLHVAGVARMAPSLIDFETLTITGPGELKLKGTLGVAREPGDLHLDWQGVQLPLIGEPDPVLRDLKGSAHLTGTLQAYGVTLESSGQTRKLPLQLKVSGKGTQRAFGIAALELRSDGGSATASGTVAWDPALAADVDVAIEKLDPGLLLDSWSGQLNGQIRARTVASVAPARGVGGIAFTAELQHSVLRGYPLSLSAAGQVDTDQLRVDQLRLAAADGEVLASGSVAWAPQLRIDAQARLHDVNPGVFAPRWKGRVNGEIHARPTDATGSASAQPMAIPPLSFDVALDHSVLRDYPFALTAQGALSQPRGQSPVVTVQTLNLSSAASRLTASGQLTPPFDVTAELHSPDLAQLLPSSSGKVDLSFTLQGPLETPHLRANGAATRLRFGNRRAASATLNADLDLAADSSQPPSKLDFKLVDADVGLRVPLATLSIAGMLAYHRIQFDAQTEEGNVSTTLQGGYDQQRGEWGGQLVALTLAPKHLPLWSLEHPAGVLLGEQRLSLEPACVHADGDGEACFNLIRAVLQPGIRLGWTLQDINLSSFAALLSKDTHIDGRLDGSGELYWVDGDVGDAHAELKLASGQLSRPDLPAIQLLPSTVTLEQRAQRLHALIALHATQGTLDADLNAATAEQFLLRPLTGHLQLHIPDIAFAALFTREVSALGGHIDGDLNVTGAIGAPRLSGRVELVDGHARLTTPGIELKQLQVTMRGDGSGPLQVEGAAESGGGKLQLAGSVDPAEVPPKVDLKLTGDHFLALANADARIFVTPDLHLLMDHEGTHVDGSVTVPEARITPQGFGSSGQSVSADQILVNEQLEAENSKADAKANAKAASASAFFAKLQLLLGDAVRFEGFGLKTRLTGGVTLTQQPQRETSAQGELRLVEGRYKAYGQDLTIDTGRLIFDGGPVTSPGIDIGAYRQPTDEVRVGVRVRGTLSRPQLSLESQPAMAREQQLSWLLFGRPLDQNSTADRSAVSSAALSLGLSGGGYLAERLGKGIGLDNIQVGTVVGAGSSVSADASSISGSQASQGATSTGTSSTQAQLTLGKYLTPKLYISYGVSLFQPGQTFRLLYDLGGGFKLQTESGAANGGDVLYTLERGKK